MHKLPRLVEIICLSLLICIYVKTPSGSQLTEKSGLIKKEWMCFLILHMLDYIMLDKVEQKFILVTWMVAQFGNVYKMKNYPEMNRIP